MPAGNTGDQDAPGMPGVNPAEPDRTDLAGTQPAFGGHNFIGSRCRLMAAAQDFSVLATPSGKMNQESLGLLDLRRRKLTEAEEEYRTALRLDSIFVPALVNPADLDRAHGMDEEGAELLRKAMAIEPDNADVRYALGLYLARKQDYPGALDLLRRAHELIPPMRATPSLCTRLVLSRRQCRSWGRAHPQHPANRDVLTALVSIAREKGDFAAALRHARELLTLAPGDEQLRAVVSDLEKRRAR